MKIIQLVNRDGSRTMGPSAPVPDNFDVQAWAEKRRASLRFIGVVEIVEVYLDTHRRVSRRLAAMKRKD